MRGYDLYVFFLCLIVFTLLTGLFTVIIIFISRLMTRLIQHGAEDERLIEEYKDKKRLKKSGKEKKCRCSGLDCLFTTLFCLIMFFVFGIALYSTVGEKKQALDIPQLRVVLSNSMSKKYEKNTYLFEENLNDQFDTFDLIITRKLPDEFDLRLYDIVVYEIDDTMVIHRIIGIEEPNEQHPNERYFRLKGDFVHVEDKFPVTYSQMRAIYKGERMPYIGSFVAFMQSPAGYLCVLLVVFGLFALPALENTIERESRARFTLIQGGQAAAKGYEGIPLDVIETATVVGRHSGISANSGCVINLSFISERDLRSKRGE